MTIIPLPCLTLQRAAKERRRSAADLLSPPRPGSPLRSPKAPPPDADSMQRMLLGYGDRGSFRGHGYEPPMRLLLISDNLPEHELIVRAARSDVEVLVVHYQEWTVEELLSALELHASGRKFASIGLFDHGGPGEFCLLNSVAGGTIDMGDFIDSTSRAMVTDFFVKLCSFVCKSSDSSDEPRPGCKGAGTQCEKNGRVDVLGCSVASTSAGMRLMQHLERVTGTRFAAAVQKVGQRVSEGGTEYTNYELGTEDDLMDVAHDYFEFHHIAAWHHHAGGWVGHAGLGLGQRAAVRGGG